MKMIVIPIFLSLIVMFFAANEFATRSTYGGFIPDSEIGPFLERHWDEMELNELNRKGELFYIPGKAPFIASHWSLFSKWHVYGEGVVPRWSKWSKKLDEKHQELFKVRKTLKDL